MSEPPKAQLSVGEVSKRAGVTVSVLHFYERQGLLRSKRTAGNQRRYDRAVLRRIALIRIAQRVGIPLNDVAEALSHLPDNQSPTRKNWEDLSNTWRAEIDHRIHRLQQIRDGFADCIGCGCLSIDRCLIANPNDVLGQKGPGPQRLVDDSCESASK